MLSGIVSRWYVHSPDVFHWVGAPVPQLWWMLFVKGSYPCLQIIACGLGKFPCPRDAWTPPRCHQEGQLRETFDFNLVRCKAGNPAQPPACDLQNREIRKGYCFKPLKLWQFGRTAIENWNRQEDCCERQRGKCLSGNHCAWQDGNACLLQKSNHKRNCYFPERQWQNTISLIIYCFLPKLKPFAAFCILI